MIEDGAIHDWFGLTYANYLVLHRTVLQSMPGAWQEEFVALLRELDAAVERANVPQVPGYRVQAVDHDGRFMRDPVPHYNRGRTRLDDLDPIPGACDDPDCPVLHADPANPIHPPEPGR